MDLMMDGQKKTKTFFQNANTTFYLQQNLFRQTEYPA